MANFAVQVLGSAGNVLKTASRDSESYWRAFGRMLDDGAAFFNPKTGKTIFTNKNVTALIDGSLPEGTTLNRGKMELGEDFWRITDRKINEEIPFESYYLFNKPCGISKQQSKVLERLKLFTVNS